MSLIIIPFRKTHLDILKKLIYWSIGKSWNFAFSWGFERSEFIFHFQTFSPFAHLCSCLFQLIFKLLNSTLFDASSRGWKRIRLVRSQKIFSLYVPKDCLSFLHGRGLVLSSASAYLLLSCTLHESSGLLFSLDLLLNCDLVVNNCPLFGCTQSCFLLGHSSRKSLIYQPLLLLSHF